MRPIDWPILWSELLSKRNTDPVSLKNKKKKEHEKEIIRKSRRGGENDKSEIKDSFAAQKI